MTWSVGELRRGGWLALAVQPSPPPDGTFSVLDDIRVSESEPSDRTVAWLDPTEEA